MMIDDNNMTNNILELIWFILLIYIAFIQLQSVLSDVGLHPSYG